MANCKYCKQEIKWPEPYSPGAKPLNLDGSVHACRTGASSAKPEKPEEEETVLSFNTSKLRILKIKKIIIDLEGNNIILTVEELE